MGLAEAMLELADRAEKEAVKYDSDDSAADALQGVAWAIRAAAKAAQAPVAQPAIHLASVSGQSTTVLALCRRVREMEEQTSRQSELIQSLELRLSNTLQTLAVLDAKVQGLSGQYDSRYHVEIPLGSPEYIPDEG